MPQNRRSNYGLEITLGQCREQPTQYHEVSKLRGGSFRSCADEDKAMDTVFRIHTKHRELDEGQRVQLKRGSVTRNTRDQFLMIANRPRSECAYPDRLLSRSLDQLRRSRQRLGVA